jgi:hypothetical protein
VASDGVKCVWIFMANGLVFQVILWLLLKNLQRFQCWYYWFEEFIRWVVVVASGGVKCVWIFMTIGSGIKVKLRSLSKKIEPLQCWYSWWEAFKMRAAPASCSHRVSCRSVQEFKYVEAITSIILRESCAWYCRCESCAINS